MRNARRAAALCAAIFLVVLCAVPVFADFGPKDRLDVYVVNPPAEKYYLDLLYETPDAPVYENLSPDEIASLDSAMLALLRKIDTGETAALATGTRIPMSGSLIGVADGNRMRHRFGYYGLPETYRIIIVTESGTVQISSAYTRIAMQSSITYDFESGAATVPPIWQQYLLQFAVTCLSTLLIEGVLLLLFRFSLRNNYRPFLLVNVLTQIALTAVVGTALILHGTVTAYFCYGMMELAILVAETAAYAFFLKGKSRARRIVYAITANAVSFALGCVSLDALYEMLTRIA